MKNFTFCNPTKIIFGDGTIPQLGEEARPFGSKALLVYGMSSIKKNGVYDKAVASLKEAGIEYIDYPGVKSNPLVSHARAGAALAKEKKVDMIIAVGGGSVLDEAKAIAAGAVSNDDIWSFYNGTAQIKAALPLVTVLTIPATGSEMNGGTVLTNDETKDKFGFGNSFLFPKVSILDPTVTYTIPTNYTSYSAVDAMCHLFEGYFTHAEEWAPIQERYTEGILKSIMESVERIIKNPSDYQGRATMMWAATLAWNNLQHAGLGAISLPNHMIEHPISGLYDIAHGAGLSIVIPTWMTFVSKKNPSRFAQFARNVMGIRSKSDKAAAKKGIAALKAWFDKIGSPTSFAAAGIASPDINKLTDMTMIMAKQWGVTEYSRADIAKLFRKMQC